MTKNLLLSDTSAAAIQKLNRLGYVDPSVLVMLEPLAMKSFGLNTNLESRDAERPRKLCEVITKEWSSWIMDGIVLSC